MQDGRYRLQLGRNPQEASASTETGGAQRPTFRCAPALRTERVIVMSAGAASRAVAIIGGVPPACHRHPNWRLCGSAAG
jgi:hypothetical protein